MLYKLQLVKILMSSVSEIMSFREPFTITAFSNRTAKDVASIITEKRISSVIVIDKENRPLGIVTERDLVERVCLTNLNASDVLVEDIMSSPLITIMAYDFPLRFPKIPAWKRYTCKSGPRHPGCQKSRHQHP